MRSRKRLHSMRDLQKWLEEGMKTTLTDEEDLIALGLKLNKTPHLKDDLDRIDIEEDEG